MNLKNNITIVIPTHIIPTSPKTSIIEKSINSLATLNELHNCKCIITCDINSAKSKISMKYLQNLQNIKSPFNTEISYVVDGQQRMNFLNGIKKVNTDYMLFWEHDWIFIQKPDLTKIIKAMNKYKFINAIFFNKRDNIIKPYPCGDFILEPETRVKEISLLKTSKWSNNPNIARISKWWEWLDIIENADLNKNNPRKQIEPPLHHKYIKEIKKLGFEIAHSKWGMYSYGKLNKNKMVEHLDGSKRY